MLDRSLQRLLEDRCSRDNCYLTLSCFGLGFSIDVLFHKSSQASCSIRCSMYADPIHLLVQLTLDGFRPKTSSVSVYCWPRSHLITAVSQRFMGPTLTPNFALLSVAAAFAHRPPSTKRCCSHQTKSTKPKQANLVDQGAIQLLIRTAQTCWVIAMSTPLA